MTLQQRRDITVDVPIKVTTKIKEEMNMANFNKVSVASDARTELHDLLSLTGAEVSLNNLPAGAGVPLFMHIRIMKRFTGFLPGRGRLS